jgi:hypothetical protein
MPKNRAIVQAGMSATNSMIFMMILFFRRGWNRSCSRSCRHRQTACSTDWGKAPSFKAETTQGEINFPDDYKEKCVILFGHPADFTPVCTTEFMTFAKMMSELEALNCKLVGLSRDRIYSHIAWLRIINEKLAYQGIKNTEVTSEHDQTRKLFIERFEELASAEDLLKSRDEIIAKIEAESVALQRHRGARFRSCAAISCASYLTWESSRGLCISHLSS